MFFRLYLSWQWAHSSLQLLIQPWICAPGTHYGWVDQGSVEYEVCLTFLHMASTGNRTPDLLILSLTPYPLGHAKFHSIIGWTCVVSLVWNEKYANISTYNPQ